MKRNVAGKNPADPEVKWNFVFRFSWGSLTVETNSFESAITQARAGLPHIDMRHCLSITKDGASKQGAL